MNRTLVLCLLLWISGAVFAQDSLRIYTWEEALAAPNKDSVFRIDASKRKWETVPAELFAFKNLRYLDLSKNKLKELPAEMSVFTKMRGLDLTKNAFEVFPLTICPLTQMRKLLLARNQIASIPSCIGYFTELTSIDLWDNPLKTLPTEFSQLKSLRTVDLRGILFSAAFQEKWQTAMPGVKWEFDPPCNCVLE